MNKELEESIIVLENWLNELNVIFNEIHINNTKERKALETTLKELKRLHEENKKMQTEIAEHVYWDSTPVNEIKKMYIPKDKIKGKIIMEEYKIKHCTNSILANTYKARIKFGQELLEDI